MPSMNILDDDAFSCSSLTAVANNLPFVPGQVGAAGLFQAEGVTTTNIMVERRDGSLTIVGETPRGGPGETVGSDSSNLVSLRVPHFQRDDTIKADEVQNVRAFGSETDLETVETRVSTKIARHTSDLDTTVELLRVGAIKGIVTGKGGAVIANLYTLFGEPAPENIAWAFADNAFKPRLKTLDVIDAIEDDLEATNYTGIHAFCGTEFFKALIDHKDVRDAYLGWQKAQELLGRPSNRFEYAGVTWERYRTGKKAKAANGDANFIAPNEARLVVTGVPDLFIERYAPADYEETVNTNGLPRYAKQIPKANNKGRDLEVQTNIISLCTQPKTLRRIVMA